MPLPLWLIPEAFPKAPPYWEFLARFSLTSGILLPGFAAVFDVLALGKSWEIRDDGVVVRTRRTETFLPWNDVKLVSAAVFGMELKQSGRPGNFFLEFVNPKTAIEWKDGYPGKAPWTAAAP